MAEPHRCRCSSVGGVGRGSSDLVHVGSGVAPEGAAATAAAERGGRRRGREKLAGVYR